MRGHRCSLTVRCQLGRTSFFEGSRSHLQGELNCAQEERTMSVRKNTSRREFIRVGLFGTSAALLAACSGAPPAPPTQVPSAPGQFTNAQPQVQLTPTAAAAAKPAEAPKPTEAPKPAETAKPTEAPKPAAAPAPTAA